MSAASMRHSWEQAQKLIDYVGDKGTKNQARSFLSKRADLRKLLEKERMPKKDTSKLTREFEKYLEENPKKIKMKLKTGSVAKKAKASKGSSNWAIARKLVKLCEFKENPHAVAREAYKWLANHPTCEKLVSANHPDQSIVADRFKDDMGYAKKIKKDQKEQRQKEQHVFDNTTTLTWTLTDFSVGDPDNKITAKALVELSSFMKKHSLNYDQLVEIANLLVALKE